MGAPLYYNASPPANVGDGHHGLWFDRFFDRYSTDWTIEKTCKKSWIESVSGIVGDDRLCKETTQRQARLCSALGGEFRVYATEWHFVTGLGNPHPVENGFLWHPTLGTPYISGAAVKGLVRTWVEAWKEFPSEAERLMTLYRWFGSEDKELTQRKGLRRNGFKPHSTSVDVDTQVGSFIFFDALPIEPVVLKPDVMTPHMGKWYEKGAEIIDLAESDRIPADWHDPVPIPFLVVQNAAFLFTVAPRNNSDDQAKEELQDVMSALDQSLCWLGAGAKTAVGYGGLERSPRRENSLCDRLSAAEQTVHERRRLEQLTPIEQEIELIVKKNEGNPAVALLQAIESGSFNSTESRQSAARRAKAIFEREKRWIPDFSGSNKQKIKQRDRCLKLRIYIEGR